MCTAIVYGCWMISGCGWWKMLDDKWSWAVEDEKLGDFIEHHEAWGSVIQHVTNRREGDKKFGKCSYSPAPEPKQSVFQQPYPLQYSTSTHGPSITHHISIETRGSRRPRRSSYTCGREGKKEIMEISGQSSCQTHCRSNTTLM